MSYNIPDHVSKIKVNSILVYLREFIPKLGYLLVEVHNDFLAIGRVLGHGAPGSILHDVLTIWILPQTIELQRQ